MLKFTFDAFALL